MTEKTDKPRALELAELIDPSSRPHVTDHQTTRLAAAELRRQHEVIVELREALGDLALNANEAMRTGGWVPTDLHQSFWQSMSTARATLTKHQEP